MKTWKRWTLAGTATLLAMVGSGFTLGHVMAEHKKDRHVAVDVRPVAVPATAQAVARGRYLYATRGCADCHGANGDGRVFIDDGAMRVAGPQIAPGRASVTAAYSPQDWVRTVRHGVKPDGRPVLIMPSEDYNRLTDADLGALVAYVRQMPAVDGQGAMVQLPLPVQMLYALGVVKDAAEKIDHRLPPQQPVEDGPTPEHGRYVAGMCVGCHGRQLAGGKIPGGPPDWPAAANLTPGEGSAMTRYADPRAFEAMMRSGKRSDGSAIRVMPFESLSKLSETDLEAVFVYLQTLPARPEGAN